MRIVLYILLFIFASCSFKPYRATLGISANSTEYKKVVEKDGGGTQVVDLCIDGAGRRISDSQKCENGGYKEDKGLSNFDPWIEFMPSYFGKSHFAWSYFFAFNSAKSTIVDYPIIGEKTDVEINRISANPIVFYNFGDRLFRNGKGLSFRFGLGAALNYVTTFKMVRRTTGESFKSDQPYKLGAAAFLEFNWNWFTFRVENSQVEYNEKKFESVPKDNIQVNNNKASFYYSYYFN